MVSDGLVAVHEYDLRYCMELVHTIDMFELMPPHFLTMEQLMALKQHREQERYERGQLRGHNRFVWQIRFFPNGEHVASISSDRTLKVWDIARGQLDATFTGQTELMSCSVAPTGVHVVGGEISGRIHFLRLHAQNP